MNLARDRNLRNDWIGLPLFALIICLLSLGFWEGFVKEIWTDRVIRPRRVAAERATENALFEKKFARDAFFAALPPERQKAVRETVLETLRENKMDAELDKFDPKDLAYKDYGPGLKLDEANWFKSKGLIGEPRWPGYKTYRTPEGIFVLFPDRIGEEEIQAEKENAR